MILYIRNGRNPAIFAVVFAVGGCQTVFVGRTSGINNNVVVIIEVHQVIQHHHHSSTATPSISETLNITRVFKIASQKIFCGRQKRL